MAMTLKQGDTFNGGRVRIDQVDADHITWTYMPTGIQHVESKPVIQDKFDSGTWMDNKKYNDQQFTVY